MRFGELCWESLRSLVHRPGALCRYGAPNYSSRGRIPRLGKSWGAAGKIKVCPSMAWDEGQERLRKTPPASLCLSAFSKVHLLVNKRKKVTRREADLFLASPGPALSLGHLGPPVSPTTLSPACSSGHVTVLTALATQDSSPGHSPSPACESGRTESCPRWLCPRHAALTRTPPSSTWQRVELWGPGGLWGCGAAWRVGSWLEQGRGPPVPALLPPAQLLGGSCLLEWEGLVGGEYPSPAS